MAEEFLTLMADLDDEAQERMSGWYEELKKAGFIGRQTPDLPFHISMATFPLDKEKEAIEITEKAAREFSQIKLHFSHIGLFAGGEVLFCAPEGSAELAALHDACDKFPASPYPWTPHATMILDDSERICEALPVMIRSFKPFVAKVTKLHLCAFWPTREIACVELQG